MRGLGVVWKRLALPGDRCRLSHFRRQAACSRQVRFICRLVTRRFIWSYGKLILPIQVSPVACRVSCRLSRRVASCRVRRGCDEWDADEHGLGGCSRIECEDGCSLIPFLIRVNPFNPCKSASYSFLPSQASSVSLRRVVDPRLRRVLSRLEWLKATIIFGHPTIAG